MKRFRGNKIKTEKYILEVYFVDNTYWDDGNRYTSRQIEFPNRTQVNKKIKEILKSGFEFQSYITTTTSRAAVLSKDHFRIFKITREEI